MFSWISVLCSDYGVLSKSLNKKISEVIKCHEKLAIAKDKKKKPAAYDSFLRANFDPQSTPRTADPQPTVAEKVRELFLFICFNQCFIFMYL